MPQKAKIVTRSQSASTIGSDTLAKGTPLTFEEIDSTLINLRDASIGVAADSGASDIQQGDTISIIGGTGITTSASGGTITIEGTSQAQGITVQAPDSSTVAVADGGTLSLAGAGGITIGTTGGVITVDATTINNAINIDGGVSDSTFGGTTAINGGTSA